MGEGGSVLVIPSPVIASDYQTALRGARREARLAPLTTARKGQVLPDEEMTRTSAPATRVRPKSVSHPNSGKRAPAEIPILHSGADISEINRPSVMILPRLRNRQSREAREAVRRRITPRYE